MTQIILAAAGALVIGFLIGFLISKKNTNKAIEEAEAKAKKIIKQAEEDGEKAKTTRLNEARDRFNDLKKKFNEEERNKLKTLIKEAIGVHMEVETLTGGLKDTVKAIADEMQIKPAVLNRAIKSAYKRDFDKARDDIDMIESILNSTDKLHNPEE